MQTLFLAWLVLPGAALGGPTLGHAVPTASQPPDGAVLLMSPGIRSLSFNEAVTPIRIQLVGSNGAPATTR